MTRASLINLAVFSARSDSLARNTEIISQITQEHACRALVIATDEDAKEGSVQAWISAHCHVTRTGKKQVCSEQISFLLPGNTAALLPNLVFAHLDSDLPFYLWWQDELPSDIDPQLWAWVDRLLFDSHAWSDFEEQMRLLEIAQIEARHRIVLCDLNWTRLLHWRSALAQFFDCASTRKQLYAINRVEVSHGKSYRVTAMLFVGWLAGQLGWRIAEGSSKDSLSFTTPADKPVAVRLVATGDTGLSHCSVFAGSREFTVTRAGADLLKVCSRPSTEEQLIPAHGDDVVELVRNELERGGPHHVYLRAVEAVRDLL